MDDTHIFMPSKIIYPITYLLSPLGLLRDILRYITAATLVQVLVKHNSLLSGVSGLLTVFPTLLYITA